MSKILKTALQKEFEAWAKLPVLNLNLETYPPLENQIAGEPRYRDPTTEIARAAWFAGRTAAFKAGISPQMPT